MSCPTTVLNTQCLFSVNLYNDSYNTKTENCWGSNRQQNLSDRYRRNIETRRKPILDIIGGKKLRSLKEYGTTCVSSYKNY